MKTKRKRADTIQPGDRIPFVCDQGELVDTVESVQLRGGFVTIRFKPDQYGFQALPIVKPCNELVKVEDK